MFQELFRKYLQKPPVQQGIILQVLKLTIEKILHTKALDADFYHGVCYANQLSHGQKIELYLKKQNIIHLAQKKLLEDFGINAIIKDIRIGNK